MIGVGVLGCGYWGPNLIRNFSEIEGLSGASRSSVIKKSLLGA